MLSRKIYYALKPAIPWPVRIALRRMVARHIRKQAGAVWPINEATRHPPPDWTGWPDNYKFSFVLTHDVEGPEGVAKCRQLAELEMSVGFRSSFNFVPAGSYTVPKELRTWLVQHGFEVGVHDLHHDGKLFSSEHGFSEKAKQINTFLGDWGAHGYRSGFMLRNLDWLHQLNIEYDASTFDTDPFEPQPDGAGTIFPFWIPVPPGKQSKDGHRSASGGGYVELPYTLPQDSTLFLVLQEKNPSIWIEKTKWVARNGGMALVNVHPDYINFGNDSGNPKEYSSEIYAEFLTTIKREFSGRYWHPLPRELATWFKLNRKPAGGGSKPPFQISRKPTTIDQSDQPSRLSGKRAAVLLYSRYPSDPRPRRAAEAMIEADMQVDLLCLAGSETDAPQETVGQVHVSRIPLTHRRDSKLIYLWQYGRFFWSSFWFLTSRSLRHRYDVIHVHNMPDFLVFAALLPRLRGARIILDLHDPMPELMESIYGLKPQDWKVAVLKFLERKSIAFSHLVLTPNITFKTLFVSRRCPPEKIQIVMNSPQQEIFHPSRYGTTKKVMHPASEFHVMHHGSIVHRHGVDLLVEAVARLRPKIPGIKLDIYGNSTPFLSAVLALAESLGIADIVTYHGAKTQTEIAEAILACDVGVVPNRRSAFIELNFPTRLFEYLAMNRPVVAPSTQGIRDYFDSDQILLFSPNDVDDLAAKILWVKEHPAETEKIVRAGAEIYGKNLWNDQKRRFVSLVSTLCGRPQNLSD